MLQSTLQMLHRVHEHSYDLQRLVVKMFMMKEKSMVLLVRKRAWIWLLHVYMLGFEVNSEVTMFRVVHYDVSSGFDETH